MGNKNKHLCPCGSGKRMKLCCRVVAHTMKLSLTPSKKLEMRLKVEELDRAGRLPAVRSDQRKAKAMRWLLDNVELVDEEGNPVSRDDLKIDQGEEDSE